MERKFGVIGLISSVFIALSCASAIADDITCASLEIPSLEEVQRVQERISASKRILPSDKQKHSASCGEGKSSVFNSRGAVVANDKIDKCLNVKKVINALNRTFFDYVVETYDKISKKLGPEYTNNLKKKIEAFPDTKRREALANLIKAESNSTSRNDRVDKYLKALTEVDMFCEGVTQTMVEKYNIQKKPFVDCNNLRESIADRESELVSDEQELLSLNQKVAQYKMCLEKALKLPSVKNVEESGSFGPE